MVEFLKRNSSNLLECSWPHEIPILEEVKKKDIIILANVPVIERFKKKYKNIYDDACKLIIFRNPYTRILSGYNYLSGYDLEFNKDLYYYLMNLPVGPTGDTPNTYNPIYVHFSLPQLESICVDKNILDEKNYIILKFEDLCDEVSELFSGYEFSNLKWLNKTQNYKKESLTNEEKHLIEHIFKNDIQFYNAVNKKNSFNLHNKCGWCTQQMSYYFKKLISFSLLKGVR